MNAIRSYRETLLTTFRLALGGGLCALLVTGCPSQPDPLCNVAHGSFAASYTLIQGEGACAELLGDVIGVQQYHPPKEGRADWDRGTVAIQATSLYNQWANGQGVGQVDSDPEHKLYAIGNYTSMDPSGGFCSVPTMAPAQLSLPEIPPEVPEGGAPTGDGGVGDGGVEGGAVVDAGPPPFPGAPAVDAQYEWRNVRIKVTARNPGQALEGTLTITQDDCTATYQVDALYPAVMCGDTPLAGAPAACDVDNPCTTGACHDGACVLECTSDRDCNPSNDKERQGAKCSADGICITPADLFCTMRDPRPLLGIPTGSGINPDFPVRCNTDLGMCALTTPVNQLP